MNRNLIALLIVLFSGISSFSQENGCCPDFNAELTIDGCNLGVCLTPTSRKSRCPNAVFVVLIHNQDGDLVYSGVQSNSCFTFDGAEPGDTYTVSGTVSQDPTPLECFPPAQILPSTLSIPEDCGCCPVINLEFYAIGCDLEVCWTPVDPNVEFCSDGITTILMFIDNMPFELEHEEGSNCFIWTGSQPGETYIVAARAMHSSGCGAGVDVNYYEVQIPEGCGSPESQETTKLGGITKTSINPRFSDVDTKVDITAYPNPTSNTLNLEGSDVQLGHVINIFSITGEVISREVVVKNNLYTKDISTLGAGHYRISIQNAEGMIIENLSFVKI